MFKKIGFFIFLITVLLLGTVNSFAIDYQEAPILQASVEEGKLEAVEERIPSEPLVMDDMKQTGKFGGTMTTFDSKFYGLSLDEPLIDKDPRTGEYIPNVAKDWTVSEDTSTYTFELREGMRWSDGHPFTAEDIIFWYEAVVHEVYPSVHSWLKVDGEAAEVTAPDDYTVTFEFAGPNPFFLDRLANGIMYGGGIEWTPKHYLKQFHGSYADKEKLEERLEEAGLDTWSQLFINKYWVPSNHEIPVLGPWSITTDPSRDELLQIAKRNPYYWKVDSEGKQLPYMDSLEWQQVSDTDVKIMKAMNSEIDLGLASTVVSDVPMLRQGEEDGNYEARFINMEGLNGAGVVLNVNQTYTGDEAVAEVLTQKEFRHALSYAVPREDVNEVSSLGLSEPRQAVLNDSHPASGPEFSQKHLELDLEKASNLLDEAGLDERDENGWRKLPNGETFTLILSPYVTQNKIDTAELLKPNLEEIGLRTRVKLDDDSLFIEKRNSGEHMVSVYNNEVGLDPIGNPVYYFATEDWTPWAPLYGKYYKSEGVDGREPTKKVERLQEIYDLTVTEPDEEKRIELWEEAMKIHSEELYQIGVISYAPWVVTVSNNMRNVPEEFVAAGWNSWIWQPEKYFFVE